MVDSNRRQDGGHVGENQEYLMSVFLLSSLSYFVFAVVVVIVELR